MTAVLFSRQTYVDIPLGRTADGKTAGAYCGSYWAASTLDMEGKNSE